ncbi:hypothetical protein BVRB_3g052550 [Beta vulgaris subsp. vulgaris]|nr:hypothetical protein BVRB_3g052550 [Beta vulgaris subsp. vulgaris]
MGLKKVKIWATENLTCTSLAISFGYIKREMQKIVVHPNELRAFSFSKELYMQRRGMPYMKGKSHGLVAKDDLPASFL